MGNPITHIPFEPFDCLQGNEVLAAWEKNLLETTQSYVVADLIRSGVFTHVNDMCRAIHIRENVISLLRHRIEELERDLKSLRG